jgi:hypothetical protein
MEWIAPSEDSPAFRNADSAEYKRVVLAIFLQKYIFKIQTPDFAATLAVPC